MQPGPRLHFGRTTLWTRPPLQGVAHAATSGHNALGLQKVAPAPASSAQTRPMRVQRAQGMIAGGANLPTRPSAGRCARWALATQYDKKIDWLPPVVTDMNEAANALRWCVGEME